jgi:hypothetical protein
MSWRVRHSLGQTLLLSAVLCAIVGCGEETAERPARKVESARKSAPASQPVPEGKKTNVGKNVFLEVLPDRRRRVLISSTVCLREGEYGLEGLLTRTRTKEHEYILAADVDARHIHLGLTLAGAREGSPVVFVPTYRPPTGTPIKVSLRYQKGGESVTVSAREWIRDAHSKKRLDTDWIFAGSRFVPNPLNEDKPDYIANAGDLICTCNMESAILDLPGRSPQRPEDRLWQANTDRIPEIGTKVVVVLEPVVTKEK